MENKGTNLTPEQALERLEELYEQSRLTRSVKPSLTMLITVRCPIPTPGLTDCLFILRCL